MKLFAHTLILLVVAILLATQPVFALNGNTDGTLIHDDHEYTYTLHVPESSSGEMMPLVIVLHSTASSGKAMQTLTGIDTFADEMDFAVVYPNSANGIWSDGRVPTDGSEAPDDSGYLLALIDHLSENNNIDPARVYMTGYGGGGLMSFKMACDYPARFKGFAIVSVLMMDYHASLCGEISSDPVNMLIIHGTESTVFPRSGRTLDNGTEIFSLGATMEFWAMRNACEPESVERLNNNTLSNRTCESGGEVIYYAVRGAIENWPRSGDFALNQFGIDASQLIMRFFSGDEDWSLEQIEHEPTMTRTFTTFVPDSYNPDTPTPLVIGLHGKGGRGIDAATGTNMNTVAQQNGFIAVYPDGIERQWAYLQGLSFYRDQGYSDIDFLENIILDVSQDLNIDPDRIYVYGISNGGFMTQRLACSASRRYAAFASVIATGYPGMDQHCQYQPPINLMMINGTDDTIVPWDGEPFPPESGMAGMYVSSPMSETVAFWAYQNHCDIDNIENSTLPQLGNSPGTEARILEFLNCDGALKIYVIAGGGHTWPGVDWGYAGELGRTNMDFQAAEAIWEFFSQFSLDDE